MRTKLPHSRPNRPRPKPRARTKPLLLRGSLAHDIAHDIGVQIVSGRYQPVDILDGELASSDRLRVSRTAYREAVRIFAAKGLVKAVRKAGTRVKPRPEWHLLDPDVLRGLFEHEPGEQLFADVFERRRMVEPEAAALAAVRRSEADLKDMAQAIQEMAHDGLALDPGQQADSNFHAALLRSTGNAFFACLVSKRRGRGHLGDRLQAGARAQSARLPRPIIGGFTRRWPPRMPGPPAPR